MRIFIVDKQALFREGLIWMLEHQSDFEVAGQAASGYEGVEKVSGLQPDVLLLENVLPDGPGFKFIPLICSKSPNTRIIILAKTDQDEFIAEAIRYGALGYLLKDISFPTLVSFLKALEDPRSNGIKSETAQLLEDDSDDPVDNELLAPSHPASLTTRELEILNYLGNGATNQEIADLLGFSMSTVKVCIRSIYSKLGLKNRREARGFISTVGLHNTF